MERRYPVIVRRFCLRPDSGGDGAFRGGKGVIRDLEFRRPIQCSILSERRITVPYGMAGGEPGKSGRNLWVRQMPDGGELVINLGGKNSAPFSTGDRIVVRPPHPSVAAVTALDADPSFIAPFHQIETPGGGGYGRKEDRVEGAPSPQATVPLARANGSLAARTLIESGN